MKFLTKARVSAAVAALLMTGLGAHAAAPTGILDLITQISFTDVITAILSIGVLVIGVDLAQLGYQRVRRNLKGAH